MHRQVVQSVEGLADKHEKPDRFRLLLASTRYRVARRCWVVFQSRCRPAALGNKGGVISPLSELRTKVANRAEVRRRCTLRRGAAPNLVKKTQRIQEQPGTTLRKDEPLCGVPSRAGVAITERQPRPSGRKAENFALRVYRMTATRLQRQRKEWCAETTRIPEFILCWSAPLSCQQGSGVVASRGPGLPV